MTKCDACKTHIPDYFFDTLDAMECINPITLKDGTFHYYCHRDLVEESKSIKSKDKRFENLYDRYINRELINKI